MAEAALASGVIVTSFRVPRVRKRSPTDCADPYASFGDGENDWPGIGMTPGTSSVLPVVLGVLVRESKFRLSQVVDLMTRRPAALRRFLQRPR